MAAREPLVAAAGRVVKARHAWHTRERDGRARCSSGVVRTCRGQVFGGEAEVHLPCARTPCRVRRLQQPPRPPRGRRFPADSVVRSSSPSASHRGVIAGGEVGSRSRTPAVPRAKGCGRAHDGCAGGGVAAGSRQKQGRRQLTAHPPAGLATLHGAAAPHRTAIKPGGMEGREKAGAARWIQVRGLVCVLPGPCTGSAANVGARLRARQRPGHRHPSGRLRP